MMCGVVRDTITNIKATYINSADAFAAYQANHEFVRDKKRTLLEIGGNDKRTSIDDKVDGCEMTSLFEVYGEDESRAKDHFKMLFLEILENSGATNSDDSAVMVQQMM